VTYHNYSLVYPTNGGRLKHVSMKSAEDPAKLTDGWRHGEGRTWKSDANPAGPLEFVYEFAQPVTIEKAQFHQHPDWPSRHLEVLVSADGVTWMPLIQGELLEKHPLGANYNFLLKQKLSAPAAKVKVRILSGYKPEHWGLGEIEFFGKGANYLPDDDWFHINVDLTDLKPGETIHYRFVAKNSHGITIGPDQHFTLPANTRPHVLTGPTTRITNGTAKVEGRLNPLGKAAQFHFEYGPTKAYGQKSTPRYGGNQITPRLAFDTLTGLQPGTEYHYRLVAVNETGTSAGEDGTFTAK